MLPERSKLRRAAATKPPTPRVAGIECWTRQVGNGDREGPLPLCEQRRHDVIPGGGRQTVPCRGGEAGPWAPISDMPRCRCRRCAAGRSSRGRRWAAVALSCGTICGSSVPPSSSKTDVRGLGDEKVVEELEHVRVLGATSVATSSRGSGQPSYAASRRPAQTAPARGRRQEEDSAS